MRKATNYYLYVQQVRKEKESANTTHNLRANNGIHMVPMFLACRCSPVCVPAHKKAGKERWQLCPKLEPPCASGDAPVTVPSAAAVTKLDAAHNSVVASVQQVGCRMALQTFTVQDCLFELVCSSAHLRVHQLPKLEVNDGVQRSRLTTPGEKNELTLVVNKHSLYKVWNSSCNLYFIQ